MVSSTGNNRHVAGIRVVPDITQYHPLMFSIRVNKMKHNLGAGVVYDDAVIIIRVEGVTGVVAFYQHTVNSFECC